MPCSLLISAYLLAVAGYAAKNEPTARHCSETSVATVPIMESLSKAWAQKGYFILVYAQFHTCCLLVFPVKAVLNRLLAYRELLGGGILPSTPGIGKGKKKSEEKEESGCGEVTKRPLSQLSRECWSQSTFRGVSS